MKFPCSTIFALFAAIIHLPSVVSAASSASQIPLGIFGAEIPPIVCKHRPENSDDSSVKQLRYFCLRGLGEIPRLMLEITRTPYDSVMYFNQNGDYKSISPTGQMPLYRGPELGDEFLAQSGAIVRHIARQTGLFGETIIEQAYADMIFETSKDVASAKNTIFQDDQTRLKALLTRVEDLLRGPYFLGEKLTYGDVGMYHELSKIEDGIPGWLASHGFGKLESFMKTIESLPEISAYLSSPRRIPIVENEVGNQPWRPDGYLFKTPLSAETVATPFYSS